MTKNWAIAIGINDYFNFAPLQYAKRDAELMRNFFKAEAEFDEVYFFSDDSPALELPNGARVRTYPSFGNLQSFLHDRFESPFLSPGDNCWFFFAGHGLQYNDRDYLMPIDANPRNIEATGISVSFVRERLSRSGADNVILMLDACRTLGSRDGQGFGEENQKGVITVSACSPREHSWEIEELQQGAFTYALLEALRLEGDRNCATVERLSQYLRHRVPDICHQYVKQEQTPRISTDPIEKIHFILMPRFATLADISVLREKAYQAAFIRNNLLTAEHLCVRAIAAARGRDMQSLELYGQIKRLQAQLTNSSEPNHRELKTGTLTQTRAEDPRQQELLTITHDALEARSLSEFRLCLRKVEQFLTRYPKDPEGERWKERMLIEIAKERQSLRQRRPDLEAIGIEIQEKTIHFFETFKVELRWLTLCMLIVVAGALALQRLRSATPDPRNPYPSSSWGTSPSAAPADDPFAPTESPSGWNNSSTQNSEPWGSNSSPDPDPWGSNSSDDSRIWSTSNFNQLETLLKEEKWQEADQETLKQLAAIVDRQEEGWLDSTSIQQLPCDALRYADQLWSQNSSGQFGFGAQAYIYRRFGGKPVARADVDNGPLSGKAEEVYDRFGKEVGWMEDNDWIFPRDAIFDLSAPRGHLPADSYRIGSIGSLDEGYVLMRYLVNCGA